MAQEIGDHGTRNGKNGSEDPSVWFYCKWCRQVFQKKFELVRHKRWQHSSQQLASWNKNGVANKLLAHELEEEEEDEVEVSAKIEIISRHHQQQPPQEEKLQKLQESTNGHVTDVLINEQIFDAPLNPQVAPLPVAPIVEIEPAVSMAASMIEREVEEDEVQIISPLPILVHHFRPPVSIETSLKETTIEHDQPGELQIMAAANESNVQNCSNSSMVAPGPLNLSMDKSDLTKNCEIETPRSKFGIEKNKKGRKITSILERLLAAPLRSTKEKKEGRLLLQQPKFGCSFCGRLFTYRANCKMHERIHTGERNYQCRFCAKTFTRSNVCNRHMASVHTEAEISHYSSLAQKIQRENQIRLLQQEEQEPQLEKTDEMKLGWKITNVVGSAQETKDDDEDRDATIFESEKHEFKKFTQQIQIHNNKNSNRPHQKIRQPSFDHSQLIVTCWPTLLADDNDSVQQTQLVYSRHFS